MFQIMIDGFIQDSFIRFDSIDSPLHANAGEILNCTFVNVEFILIQMPVQATRAVRSRYCRLNSFLKF